MIDDRPQMLPGDARCPGPSTRELLSRDVGGAPRQAFDVSYEFRGDRDVPFEDYTSRERLQAEYDHMWSRVWQWACREEHIPNVGDYYVYDIGDRSVIVTRTDSGIKAYNNFCLHRGTQLRPSATQGATRQFRCPFHGWTWNLDGQLVDVPCRWDFPHVTDEEFELPQVQVGQWGGFVFINLDPAAPPLEEYLGVLTDHFDDPYWDLSQRYVELHVRKQLPCNWKAAAEAFLEAYHVWETHSQAVYSSGDAQADYDVFPPNVSRFWQPQAVPSPHLDPQPTDDDVLRALFARKQPGAALPERPQGWTSRDIYGKFVKEQLSKRYGRDLTGAPTSIAIDPIQYFLFPNAFFFPGLAIPMAYRFRPSGDDPDRCVFDLLFLRPTPAEGEAPFPAEPYDLGLEDSYTTVPGVDPSFGLIYDQDTTNLILQTRGFKGSVKRGQTLGNYQEVRTRHLHETIDQYISGER